MTGLDQNMQEKNVSYQLIFYCVTTENITYLSEKKSRSNSSKKATMLEDNFLKAGTINL